MQLGRKLALIGAVAAPLAWVAGTAAAEEPLPWEMGMQAAASPVRDHIDGLHDGLLVIITLIALFVLGLLLYVILRFNARRHPTPSRRTHNTWLEVIWTAVPILILLGIFIPSFKLIYFTDKVPHADMTVKVTGHQWYWNYTYPDQANLSFDSNMIPEDEAVKTGKLRLLDVDNPLVVPVDTNIRILVEGVDVIHSWFVPAMGVQEYAVVGRTNESWMNVERPGMYYGQCNQICGVNHPFMPIAIQAVSKDEFGKWVEDAKKKFSHDAEPGNGRPAVSLAAAAAR
jgi:cytochrome c oxidase subunit II